MPLRWLLCALRAGGPRAELAVRATAVLIGVAISVTAREQGLGVLGWIAAPVVSLVVAICLGEGVRRARTHSWR
jgi:hypothetical protein